METTRQPADHLAEGEAIIALGSNIGDKRANIARALRLLAAGGDIEILQASRDYRTPPWGKTDQDWFVNSCARVRTTLAPHRLLDRCLTVERQMGRVRTEKWGPRVIDLDVLVHGREEIADDVLVLPHPHITARAFVLAPLADVAPGLVLKGRPVADWLRDIDTTGVEPMGEVAAG